MMETIAAPLAWLWLPKPLKLIGVDGVQGHDMAAPDCWTTF